MFVSSSSEARGRLRARVALSVLALLTVAACDDDDPAPPPVAPEPTFGIDDVLPGVVITVEGVHGGTGPSGRARVGDKLTVDFTVATTAGDPLELTTMARGSAMISGPTNNYQRVIAATSDVLTGAVKRDLGKFSYTFAVPIPSTYLAPINDTPALTEGELTGQALLSGTYTIGLELRKDYVLEGTTFRDPGNATVDFLFGDATTIERRELVTLANCNQCHTELTAHGDNRNNVANCILCHTSGAEDGNNPAVAGGTPGVSIDFKVMIHKIHSGKRLPSVLGVTTNPNGTRKYDATPQPYIVLGRNDSVNDFSSVTWPNWPSFFTPMPRDSGFTTLTSTQQSLEDSMRRGPVECAKCHGDPDGAGPLPAPAGADLVYSQPSIAVCASCHDDWVPSNLYTSNLQTMPIQVDNSACKNCHKQSGTPLDVIDAHRHPLVDPAVAVGLSFEVSSITDVGGTPNGRFEPGEKIEITFQAKDGAGNPVAASSLARIEPVLSGPTTNPQMITYARVAPAFFTGTGPYTFRLPEIVWLEPIGVSTGALGETFTSLRAPHWNVSGATSTLLLATGTGAATILAAPAKVTDNYVDVAPGTGSLFADDNYVLIDGSTVGVREYIRIQYVEGDRLWFGSTFRTDYKPNLKIAHAAGAAIAVVTTTSVPTSSYTLAAATGTFTETVEFGTGEVLCTYTSDFVVPSVYPGALEDTPVHGEDWGDWTGLPLLDGTYTFDMHGSRSLSVVRFGETTSYTEGADSTVVKLLFGSATSITEVTRIDPQACYGCHENLQFHGGSRRSVEACLQCHGNAGTENSPPYIDPVNGTYGNAAEFRFMLHQKHIDVFPATPGGVQDCAKCHGQNTAWTLPAERLHPQQTTHTRSWFIPCSSCHTSTSAIAHMDVNTSSNGSEACAVCHGSDDALNVQAVHKIR